MSYLTPVCGRFHGKFANPRGVSRSPPVSRRSRNSPRFSSLVQSLPREREKSGTGLRWRRRIHYFLRRRISRRFVLLARDSHPSTRKAGLIRLAPSLPLPPPVFLIRQVIQIKLLRKLLLYSSARLRRNEFARLSGQILRWICWSRLRFLCAHRPESRESQRAFILSFLTRRSCSQRIPDGRSGDETAQSARSVLATWSRCMYVIVFNRRTSNHSDSSSNWCSFIFPTRSSVVMNDSSSRIWYQIFNICLHRASRSYARSDRGRHRLSFYFVFGYLPFFRNGITVPVTRAKCP